VGAVKNFFFLFSQTHFIKREKLREISTLKPSNRFQNTLPLPSPLKKKLDYPCESQLRNSVDPSYACWLKINFYDSFLKGNSYLTLTKIPTYFILKQNLEGRRCQLVNSVERKI